ncbi:hypothetical protein CROQUDRAFT_32272, partial [Cronartium quercuum f. sp. fusiforme G11]
VVFEIFALLPWKFQGRHYNITFHLLTGTVKSSDKKGGPKERQKWTNIHLCNSMGNSDAEAKHTIT